MGSWLASLNRTRSHSSSTPITRLRLPSLVFDSHHSASPVFDFRRPSNPSLDLTHPNSSDTRSNSPTTHPASKVDSPTPSPGPRPPSQKSATKILGQFPGASQTHQLILNSSPTQVGLKGRVSRGQHGFKVGDGRVRLGSRLVMEE